MGTHYASPFAVIFMDYVENIALSALRENDIRPEFYRRYIDDIIMGPFPKDTKMFEKILNEFNCVTEAIKFTIEVPNKFLNFLDVSICIDNNEIKYKHYTKEVSSDNCLNKSSWVPNHIKTNFVTNAINTAQNRCNSDADKKDAEVKIKKKLKMNGYNDSDWNRKRKNKRRNYFRNKKRSCNFTLPYVSDSLNRKINSLVHKYDLAINVLNSSNKKLKDVFYKKKNRKKHGNCYACEVLPSDFDCSVSNVVYEFVCKKCAANYIGKTCRSFRARYLEHKRSIRYRDDKSALSVHVRECECDGIGDFDVKILECVKRPLDIALLEARWIRRSRPLLNRCDELSEW
ncbi:MAG: hypothetical protein AAGK05_16680 [Pseudomonadota bacterium]